MAGPTTKPSGEIVPAQKPQDAVGQIQALIQKMQPEMARALPKHVTADRMARIVLTAVRTNPRLAECTPASFLGCVMSLAQLGLEPNTPLGHAYLIPRRNKKRNTTECTMLIGYQGMLDLARRSGQVTNIYAYVVRAGDAFKYRLGTERYIEHVPSDDPQRESRAITHVYAVAKIKDGEPEFEVLTLAQVNARRNRSMAGQDGPWVTDLEAMTLKTAARALFRWIPKSAEMARVEALEVAVDKGGSLLAAADETVTALLAAHGMAEEAEVETDKAQSPSAGNGAALPSPASSATVEESPGATEASLIAEERGVLLEVARAASKKLGRVLVQESGDLAWLVDSKVLEAIQSEKTLDLNAASLDQLTVAREFIEGMSKTRK